MDTTDVTVAADVAALVEELGREAGPERPRRILGLVGAPGTGKTTLAQLLQAGLGTDRCVVVPMDGFHLADAITEGTPLRARKGAIDTFDVHGYLSLLSRIRARKEPIVYAPSYRRGLEDPIAASIAVPRAAEVIITEGNYLLAEEGAWAQVRDLLDEVWYLDTPDSLRVPRLIERHIASGMTRDQAVAWAGSTDQANAEFVASTRGRADRIIPWV
ncbi:nucleoside/nucleotide kinase family protein [Plantibacter flavus]|uniref:nucleoside/nucleotide kinase family protein n=1 Tax=Plantibacter flavus TaxID=150123 RepID=UPI003F5CCE7E